MRSNWRDHSLERWPFDRPPQNASIAARSRKQLSHALEIHARGMKVSTSLSATQSRTRRVLCVSSHSLPERSEKTQTVRNSRLLGLHQARWRELVESMLKDTCFRAYPESAMCVQRFDDSLNSAIRITYRILLRSSSLREPRYPLLRVVLISYYLTHAIEPEGWFVCVRVQFKGCKGRIKG